MVRTVDPERCLLWRSQRCSRRWPEREPHQTCEIPCVLG